MSRYVLIFLAGFSCCVLCKPLENFTSEQITTQLDDMQQSHNIEKRFINPIFNLGSFAESDLAKLRTKRSDDECEKLELCKLHVRSNYNFFAAYQLYFINKENARLWDHHARSLADCENRYGDCYKK